MKNSKCAIFATAWTWSPFPYYWTRLHVSAIAQFHCRFTFQISVIRASNVCFGSFIVFFSCHLYDSMCECRMRNKRQIGLLGLVCDLNAFITNASKTANWTTCHWYRPLYIGFAIVACVNNNLMTSCESHARFRTRNIHCTYSESWKRPTDQISYLYFGCLPTFNQHAVHQTERSVCPNIREQSANRVIFYEDLTTVYGAHELSTSIYTANININLAREIDCEFLKRDLHVPSLLRRECWQS